MNGLNLSYWEEGKASDIDWIFFAKLCCEELSDDLLC